MSIGGATPSTVVPEGPCPGAFSQAATRGYLNTASVGLPPDAAIAAGEEALRRWQREPDWLAWEAVGEECRAAFSRLLGTSADDVALTVAAHVMAATVAAGIADGRRGANVVALAGEHQSALWPFLTLADRGYELRLVDAAGLPQAIDANTALVAVSLVQSADGSVIDLSPLEGHDALLYVDGTQAVGVLDHPIERIDVLSVSAYKWLHSPRGIAFSFVREQARERVSPVLASWKSAVEPWGDPYGPPRELTPSARRYDLSLPWLAAPPALASLELLNSLGVDRVGGHCRGLAAMFADGVGIPRTGSSIVAVKDADPQRVHDANLTCSIREGMVRLSFGLYNDVDDVTVAIEACRGGS